MYKLPSLVLILLLPIIGFTQGIFKDNILTKFKGQKEYLMTCIEMMDEADFDFKPTDDEMTARALILHMGGNMLWIARDYMQGGAYDKLYDKKDLTKEELRKHMESVFDYAINTLDAYPRHMLNTKVDFFAGDKNMMQLVELMDDHMTHHRGQLTVYLRLVGKKAPRLVGW